jgi:hypothetical protein
MSEECRQRIINKIVDCLQRHCAGPDSRNELKKIALRFEDKVYTNSANQQDYLRRISLKMLSLESKANTPLGNYFPGSCSGNHQWPLDPAIGGPREEVYEEQSQGDIGMVVDGPPPQSVPVETIQRALRVLFLSYLPRDAPDLPVVDDLAELGVPDAALAPALQVLETLRDQERRIVELEEELRGLRALC